MGENEILEKRKLLESNFTHIVANGCSMTYGLNLDTDSTLQKNPSPLAWPSLLAKKLEVPIINLSLPGCGNDSILRRTTEFLFDYKSETFKPFIIIAWTQFTRREYWSEEEKAFKNNYDYMDPEFSLDIEYQSRRSLLYMVNLQSLMELFKYPYIHGCYFNKDFEDLNHFKFKMFDFLLHTPNFWKGGLDHYVKHIPKLKCRHETIQGHFELYLQMLKILQSNYFLPS